MKQKTIAESIADLRATLDNIESSSSVLTESVTPPTSRLQEHMNEIINEEGLVGNFLKGLKWKAPKGEFAKNPKIPGQKRTWSKGPPTTGDKVANTIGKAVLPTVGAGVAATAGIAADRLSHGQPMPWSDDDKPPTPPAPPTPPEPPKPDGQDTKPDNNNIPVPPPNNGGDNQGTDAKPHYQFSEKAQRLQQWLNGQGANLTVDGKYGPLTQAAWADYKQGKLGKHNTRPVTPNQPDIPDIPDLPPAHDTATQPNAGANTGANTGSNAEMTDLLNQLKAAVADMHSTAGSDPGAQADLDAILKSAGL